MTVTCVTSSTPCALFDSHKLSSSRTFAKQSCAFLLNGRRNSFPPPSQSRRLNFTSKTGRPPVCFFNAGDKSEKVCGFAPTSSIFAVFLIFCPSFIRYSLFSFWNLRGRKADLKSKNNWSRSVVWLSLSLLLLNSYCNWPYCGPLHE